ncbi:MAG: hypothetical protein WBQ66_02130 [Blastocatellia bacterium]
MTLLLYLVAGICMTLGFGGLVAFATSRHIGVLLGALVFIGSGVAAIVLVAWWPFLVGFVVVWALRFLGLDPEHPPR